MSIDEYIRRPCGFCGRRRTEHLGRSFCCPQGYGTLWSPDAARDYRVWPLSKAEKEAGQPAVLRPEVEK